jgi:uncharacterized protein (TIGR03435 family)
MEDIRFDRITAGGTPISGIVNLIAAVVGRPVVDGTGLSTPFDIELKYRPARVAGDSATDEPTMFTAIQEQLGLKLEASTTAVEVIVVDKAEAPTPD